MQYIISAVLSLVGGAGAAYAPVPSKPLLAASRPALSMPSMPPRPGQASKPGPATKPGPESKPDQESKPGPAAKPDQTSKPGQAAKPGQKSKLGQAAKPDQKSKPQSAPYKPEIPKKNRPRSNASQTHGYTPSIYDSQSAADYPNLAESKGYIASHDAPSSVKKFGDISIISLNTHINKDTLEEEQKRQITKLVDTHHPAVLAFQGISKDVMDFLRKLLGGHYAVASYTHVDIDQRTRRKEYKPIFYDTRVLARISESVFEPREGNQAYATIATFEHTATKQMFTVFNVDLYSINKKKVDAQFFNMINHYVKSYASYSPLFIVGTINVQSSGLKSLLTHSFKNLPKMDSNNKRTKMNTFHNHGEFKDNVPRDFTYLYDKQDVFKLNYSRILEKFDKKAFEHYPIYSVLTVKKKSK